MSVQVRVSNETYKSLKDYCEKGEKPQMLAVIGVAVAEYLERKNGRDEIETLRAQGFIGPFPVEQAASVEGG